MNKKLKKKLRTIADHYGLFVQLTKLAEECAEYAAAHTKVMGYLELVKEKPNKANYFRHLAIRTELERMKELADVVVLVEQIKYLCGETSSGLRMELEEHMTKKVNRQLKRIKKEKNYDN